ncbi:MAG TPA: hypothetical protein ENK18_23235 [Deltaproteobacteria bacterium]|nr:hypothetical protein [Deltaproteobacteria bacterium]
MIVVTLPLVAAAQPLPETTGAIVGDAYVERLVGVWGPGFDPDRYDVLLEAAAGRAPAEVSAVRLEAVIPSGAVVELHELLPGAPPVPIKEAPGRPRAISADLPGETAGALSGRAVYVSQCHGWIWSDPLGRFATQRGNLFSTVEDLHNPEGADQYLVRYLENAGAAVFTAKERDINPLLALSDNDGSGYTEVGSGFADGPAGFADTAPYIYGEDPFDAGTTRTFPADGGGVARWQPTVPADGTYAVYVSWDSDPGNASDAHYRISHPGGTIDRTFDQTVHGSTWQYVETLWLSAGTSLTVELIGDSGQAGAQLSADAVRIGGGMGDVMRQGDTSQRPRWEGGAIQHVQYNGAPTSIYDPYGDGTSGDGGSDPSSRSRWADWEHPAGEDAVYLSWHSNAASGTARGTTVYYGGGCATAGSYELALSVQGELIDAFTTWWEPGWSDRGVNSSCFSELDSGHNDEMPAVLVELAFHDNAADADHLKHPVFRDDASRAMYRGIVRYFAERDGITPVYLPEPPVAVSLTHDPQGGLVASWAPGPEGAPYGDRADRWILYTSADGRAWSSGTEVSSTSAPVAAEVGEAVYVRVSGINDGGISFPSEVVGAVRSGHGTPPILIVGAFDRLDRGLLDTESIASLGGVVRMDLGRMNAGDIVAVHGRAIQGAGYAFDGASDEALDGLELSAYRTIVWATGEESTVDETFSDAQQQLIRDHLAAGGTLWASGAEILWDLDPQGSLDDLEFAEQILGATLADDAAGTTLVDGEGILAGLTLDFGVPQGASYPVEYPDVLASDREVIARYGDGGVAGVLGEGVALLGFPFEAIGDPDARIDAAGGLLDALLLGWTPPTETSTGGTDTGAGGPGPGTDTPGGTGPAGPAPDGIVREDLGRGCGCATRSAGAGGAAWGWLLVLIVACRRIRS